MTADTMLSVGVLVAVIGCFVGLAGWLSGRDRRVGEDREWRGQVNAKLDVACGISRDVDVLQKNMQTMGERVAKVEASASSAHHRIDTMEGKQ